MHSFVHVHALPLFLDGLIQVTDLVHSNPPLPTRHPFPAGLTTESSHSDTAGYRPNNYVLHTFSKRIFVSPPCDDLIASWEFV